MLLYFQVAEEIAKRPTIDTLAAKVEVLEAENESLKKFLKESSEEETKKKKELLEKHTRNYRILRKNLRRASKGSRPWQQRTRITRRRRRRRLLTR
jgi:hypothetical protein